MSALSGFTCPGYPLSISIHAISSSPIHLLGKCVLRMAVCSFETTRNLHHYFASFISRSVDKCNNNRDGDDNKLVIDIKKLIDTYYRAESDRKLGRLRGTLMKQAKELHARAINNSNPKVRYKLEDLKRLGLIN